MVSSDAVVVRRRLLILLLTLIGFYLLLMLALYLSQDGIIFPGSKWGPREITAAGVREVTLRGRDGPFRVAEYEPDDPVAVLVFFVGNGEDLASAAWRARNFGGHRLLVVSPEYPGYGGSAGTPTVATLYAAAEAVADHAAELARARELPLVCGGISLGTFCAVHLAAQGRCERLFLAAPPSSLLEAAQARFGWLPLSLLLRHRFDNVALAPQVQCPVLIVHGEADGIVPIALGERLLEAFTGTTSKTLIRVPGTGHNGLLLGSKDEVGMRVGAFLRGR